MRRIRAAVVLVSFATMLHAPPGLAAQDGIFAGRRRGPSALKRKGGKPTAESIEAGLARLVAMQHKDGGFGAKESRVAPTALAVLAFLANGKSFDRGAGKKALARAELWLRKRIDKSGWLLDKAGRKRTRRQAIACLALVEAFVQKGGAVREKAARRTLRALEGAQARDGAWGIAPGRPSEARLLGWIVPALFFARRAKLGVPEKVWKRTDEYIETLIKSEDKLPDPGACLFAAYLLGVVRTRHAEGAGADQVLAEHPESRRDDIDLENFMIATYAMYQSRGRWWKQWKKQLAGLRRRQVKTGAMRGAWDLRKAGGKPRDAVEATALAVLTQQVYYRYLPLF